MRNVACFCVGKSHLERGEAPGISWMAYNKPSPYTSQWRWKNAKRVAYRSKELISLNHIRENTLTCRTFDKRDSLAQLMIQIQWMIKADACMPFSPYFNEKTPSDGCHNVAKMVILGCNNLVFIQIMTLRTSLLSVISKDLTYSHLTFTRDGKRPI